MKIDSDHPLIQIVFLIAIAVLWAFAESIIL
jgi:hypothetical protein